MHARFSLSKRKWSRRQNKMSGLSFGHVAIAVILNVLLITGTGAGVHYLAPALSNGNASVGFQGTQESGVTHIYLTITDITFQGGSNTTDSVYFTSPTTIDLLSLVDVTKMLGDVSVSPGHYNMIRFDVSSAVATISGYNQTLKVPSGEVKAPVQFDVARGQTTSIILTISADDILIVHNHILRPVVVGAQVIGPS
jgi:hypothetical protein